MNEKNLIRVIKVLWVISALIIFSAAMSQLEDMGWFGTIVMIVFIYGGFAFLAEKN